MRPLARLSVGNRTVGLLLVDEEKGASCSLPVVRQRDLASLLDEAGEASGNLLRRLRVGNGVTQIELAAALGVSQPMVCKFERAKIPTPESIARFKRAVEAIVESRELFLNNPPTTLEGWLAARAPLMRLAASRKRRAPAEREILRQIRDEVAGLEQDGRTKASGERATRRMR